jgi:hypothetical protein
VLNLDQVPARGNSRTRGGPNRVGRAGLNRFPRMDAGPSDLKGLMGGRVPMFGARKEGARKDKCCAVPHGAPSANEIAMKT